MKVPEIFKKGAKALALTAALGACSAPESGNNADAHQIEAVSDKVNTLVNFCLNSPSDVDGLDCTIKAQGEPVVSLGVDCWQVKEDGTLPISDTMAAHLAGTDKLDIKQDCEVRAGQW